ncbi:DUF4118 domain-containing protein [Actinomadura sp. ATCC 39365]
MAALVAPLIVAVVLLPWRESLPNTSVALVLVVVVVGVAAVGNRLAGAVAALSAAVWFDFFFTRPYQEFAIAKAADVQTAILLLIVGVAVSQLAAYARRMRVVTSPAPTTSSTSTRPPNSPRPPRELTRWSSTSATSSSRSSACGAAASSTAA